MFTENRPEFAGFTDYYEEHILPSLQLAEGARKSAVSTANMVSLFIAIAAVFIVPILWMKTKHPGVVVFGIAAAVMAVVGARAYFTKTVKAETKSNLVSGICNFIGWEFNHAVDEPPVLEPLIENGLLPKRYHRVKFEDRMNGNAHGADFEALEAHMERREKTKNGERWITVFRGSLMAIDFHREFLGKTVVLRDKGIFNVKKKSDMKRVGLVDPVFEKIFEAYGNDQVEARYLLTPDFMQRLVDLEKSVDGKKIRFGFIQGLLLIAVETPNRFEAGSMFKPLTDTARTQKILAEISAIFDLVDGVMKPQSPESFNT